MHVSPLGGWPIGAVITPMGVIFVYVSQTFRNLGDCQPYISPVIYAKFVKLNKTACRIPHGAFWAVIPPRGLKRAANPFPTMAVTSALVFAGQMINYTIPGTGSSGHLCGGMLLSSLLGPQAGFLSMVVILTIQCLFFADGGLLALGANCWNMAFYGCFVGY